MFKQTTMIESVIDAAQSDALVDGWHFKYQPVNGGPIVSRPILNYGSDWVQLDLYGIEKRTFFVHERQMAWAMVDWDCENLPPYTGQPLSRKTTGEF